MIYSKKPSISTASRLSSDRVPITKVTFVSVKPIAKLLPETVTVVTPRIATTGSTVSSVTWFTTSSADALTPRESLAKTSYVSTSGKDGTITLAVKVPSGLTDT